MELLTLVVVREIDLATGTDFPRYTEHFDFITASDVGVGDQDSTGIGFLAWLLC